MSDDPKTTETPHDDDIVPTPEAVAHLSQSVLAALRPLPIDWQLSVACTVLVNLLVRFERFTREVALDGNAAQAREDMRATTLDAVQRLATCYAAMQQAKTPQDLEQAVRLFEDHPGGGAVN